MEFLQTTYFQVAAVVIAVLLLLLLIILIRRRHTTTSDEVRSGFSGARVDETVAPLVDAQTDRPSFPASTPPGEPSSLAAPGHSQTPPPTLAMDPLVAAVASMIARPDRLTDSDFRRLAIYRPDRVMAAVSSLSSTVGADRHAAAKLEKLAAIRGYLESPAAESSGSAAPAPHQGVGPVPTEPMIPSAHEPGASGTATEPTPPAEATEPPVGPQPEAATLAAMEPGSGAEGPLLAHEPDEWEALPETEGGPALVADLDSTNELEAQVPTPPAPDAPSPPPSLQSERELTAEQFLQLPEDERVEALHRLPAAELGTALHKSRDNSVSLQVIDRLEELGTPEALLALEEFLGNADSPHTQLYALSAAERLLAGRTEE